ncbi:hypothetical protein DSUL_60235 [Desulfovibrionales bacterium]
MARKTPGPSKLQQSDNVPPRRPSRSMSTAYHIQLRATPEPIRITLFRLAGLIELSDSHNWTAVGRLKPTPDVFHSSTPQKNPSMLLARSKKHKRPVLRGVVALIPS